MSANVLAFPSTRTHATDKLRGQLLRLNDRGWLNSRIVATIIGARPSALCRFLKGADSLTPRHVRALLAWRDEFALDWPNRCLDHGGAR